MAARKSPSAGAKPDKLWTDALRRAVMRRAGGDDDPQAIERLADKCVELGLGGDMGAIREIGDRLDGKAPQAMQLSGDAENPIEVIRRVIVDAEHPDS